jgi:hypothetical protein
MGGVVAAGAASVAPVIQAERIRAPFAGEPYRGASRDPRRAMIDRMEIAFAKNMAPACASTRPDQCTFPGAIFAP